LIKDEARSATAGQDDEPVNVSYYCCLHVTFITDNMVLYGIGFYSVPATLRIAVSPVCGTKS